MTDYESLCIKLAALMDGVPLYNVNHMFGFFSVFNPDALKNVTLYKGGFPARYGGRISSVVDVRMKDGDMQHYHGNFSIGLISSKLNLEGPIVKDKLSFNLSLRRTYSDALTNLYGLIAKIAEPEVEKFSVGYYFYDLNAKLNWKISDKDRLFLSWYSGDDKIYANVKWDYQHEDLFADHEKLGMNWKWGNKVGALRWNHIISPRLFMDASASYTQYRHDLGMSYSAEEKEALLEEKRELRYEPEYYQDFRKMNELDEEIDQIHNDLAHLMEEWERLSA